MNMYLTAALCATTAGSALAGMSVSTYDDLTEDFYGQTMHYNGVTYTDINNVDGVFPDGNTFEAGAGVNGLGNEIIVENATLFHNEFPGWGSANNVLTFGSSYLVGDNVSLGAISTVTMNLDSVADFASLEMAYYENGPWGNIVYHLDAYLGGSLVDSDSFTISNLGGRDNIAFASLSVGGGNFDSMQLYATFGNEFTAPRIIMDNLTINSVPTPASGLLFVGAAGLVARRRR
jgi:hypothetical protein